MSYEPRFSSECPSCGEVELAVDQLWLVIPSVGRCHFDFHCPGCETHVVSTIEPQQAELLAALVAVEELDVPEEALEQHDGPALTSDDLIDLMLSLEAWPATADA